MKTNTLKIFLDMDGVVADFDASFQTVSGIPIDKADKKTIRSLLDNSDHIFKDAPIMKDAKELVSALLKIDPELVFLSSLPYNNFFSSYNQKIQWLVEHLQVAPNRLKPVFTDLGKWHLAKDRKCILIDDYSVHITEWQGLGMGTGIHYYGQSVQSVVNAVLKVNDPQPF